jgi:integrase/recombinase XerD
VLSSLLSHIRNKNTRIAYYHAIGQFLDWCQHACFQSLEDIEPITVAAYIEQHPGSPPTVQLRMAAIRMFFSWLTEKGVLPINPARKVKTPKFSRTEGKTPAFSAEAGGHASGLDRYEPPYRSPGHGAPGNPGRCSRIGAAVSLKVQDYFQNGKRTVIRLRTKGGK